MNVNLYNKRKVFLFYKYNCRCAYCDSVITFKEMTIDHIIPKSKFKETILSKVGLPEFLKHLTILDVNDLDNLNPCCLVCNITKKTFSYDLFKKHFNKIR